MLRNNFQLIKLEFKEKKKEFMFKGRKEKKEVDCSLQYYVSRVFKKLNKLSIKNVLILLIRGLLVKVGSFSCRLLVVVVGLEISLLYIEI